VRDSDERSLEMSGEPSHIELGVPEVERAKHFYGELLGWTFADTGMGARIATGGASGGVHDDDVPNITVFFMVDDLDAAAQRVVELGGEVGEGIGEGGGSRFLYSCRDDQGVPFGLQELMER
jgi:predicted enzyme related to lactoylglutathione lyase